MIQEYLSTHIEEVGTALALLLLAFIFFGFHKLQTLGTN